MEIVTAFCFYGARVFDDGMVVRHKSGDVMDISRTNIILGTSKDNAMDIPETYRKQRGKIASLTTAQKKRSLLDKEVRQIRKMLEEGVRQIEISKQLNVRYYVIHDIKRRRTYLFVSDTE